MRLVEDGGGTRLKICVKPRARVNRIVGIYGDALKVDVTAPPVGGAANRGLREYLAKILDVAPSGVEIVSGGSSRHKIVRIEGMLPGQVRALLSREKTGGRSEEAEVGSQER